MSVASPIPEILKEVFNFLKGHVTILQGKFFTPGVNPVTLDPKFEERSFIHSRNIKGV